MSTNLDREWSQEELRRHALSLGMQEGDIGDEPIPQGVKYLNNDPLTDSEVERGRLWLRQLQNSDQELTSKEDVSD